MSKAYAAVLIAVGTELSQGQVINSNTAWLANHLREAGLEKLLHLTVPDDHTLILSLLEFAALQSDLVIVCGGLGPTSDDFTRDVIADWLNLELVLNADSWKRLQARAQKHGYTLGASQQRQCFFPEQAEIIVNPAGTADAFVVQKQELQLYALPGPPREIREIWSASLANHLSSHFPEQVPTRLHLWQCMGIGEGNLAEKVDQVIANQAISCQVGYRAHFPYIEVKLWLSETENTTQLLQAVETLLAPWVVLRQYEDSAMRLIHSLPPNLKIKVYDFGSQGALARRFSEVISQLNRQHDRLDLTTIWQPVIANLPEMMTQLAQLRAAQAHETVGVQTPESDKNELILVLGAVESDHHWGLGLIYQDELKYERLQLPSHYNQQQIQVYQAEMALIHWWNWQNEKSAT